jgi:hypothetical protein
MQQVEVKFPHGGSAIVPHVGLGADAPPKIVGQSRPLKPCRKGLGDKVEALLASIGITEDLVAGVLKKFGLPCGCAKRKAWLNKVSDWWRRETTPAGDYCYHRRDGDTSHE